MDFPHADRKHQRKITPEEKHSTINQINKCRRDHKDLVTPEWWKQVWADFNDDTEEILEYLESLCRHCLSETEGKKGREYCPKCETMIEGEYIMSTLEELKTAQDEYTAALVRLADVKHTLKTAESEMIIAGVEGKNQSERDAKLRISLQERYDAESVANIDVILKRGAFENASRQFEFDQITAQI